MTDGMKSAHLGGVYVLAAAIIGVAGGVIAAMLTWWLNVPAAPRLAWDRIEVIPQITNTSYVGEKILADKEIATVRLLVENANNQPVMIKGAELVVDAVSEPNIEPGESISTTMARIAQMDHAGHLEVLMQSPQIGDRIKFSIHQRVPPMAKSQIIVWFRRIDRDAPPIQYVRGRIRLTYDRGELTTGPIHFQFVREAQTYETVPDFDYVGT